MNLLTNMLMLAVDKTMFNNIKHFASQMSSQITAIAWTIFMLAIVIAGICWVVGGQTAQFAKSTLGRTIIGIALVALAAAIVSTVASLFGKSAGKLTIDPAFTSYVLNNLVMLVH